MRNSGALLLVGLLLFSGTAWSGKLLSIERRETIPDDPHPSACRKCFTTGRAKEQLLDLKRDTPFALPKAAIPAGTTDTINIIGIRVDFTFEDPDDPTTTGRGVFDLRDTAQFLADEGHALDPAPHNRHYFEAHLRSLARYWEVASSGRLYLAYDVWPREGDSAYHLNKTIAHYGAQEPAYGLGEFFHDALNAAYAAEGDSLTFRDERGKRRAIIIFHAGSDRQTDLWFSPTTTPNDLFTGFLTFDGNNRWFLDADTTIVGSDTTIIGRDTIVEGVVMPETMSQDNRVTCMNAVMAHEFGHHLGLVDLYNTGSTPFLTQMGDFALMDNMGMNTAAYLNVYGVGAFGTVPVFPMAWSRAYLGFEEVVEFRRGTSIELAAVKMLTSETKIAKIPISSTEYYLLENRRSDVDGEVGLRQDSSSNVILWPARYDPIGDSIVALREYDLYLPLGSAGIAIWHVDEMVAAMDYFPFDGFENNFDANTLQWDPRRRFIALVEADGIIDFGGNYHRGFGEAEDLFYRGNNSAFGTYTNPATIANDGGYTHIRISNISAPGMVVTFDLNQEKMADNFPRRMGIPDDPALAPLAADLDGDGDDEIVAVSRQRLLAVLADGRSFIDPAGNWDTDPKNLDTIYSTIQATTDAHSGRPIDTSYALMPVFADLSVDITAGPVVATFNDTTVVMAGTAGGRVYSYLPYDTPTGQPGDGRAELFRLRSTTAGPVAAIIPDTARDIIHVVHRGGSLVSAAWDASGPLTTITHDFGETFIGGCRYRDGMALLFTGAEGSMLFRTRDVPLAWVNDSLILDSIIVDGYVTDTMAYHAPIATDFNRDGNDEIALLSRDGKIRVFSFGPAGIVPYAALDGMVTGDTAAAGPVAADFSGDGYPEFIVPGTNLVYGYDRNGYTATDFPLDIDYGRPGQIVITPPIVSDITGDGHPDVVVTTFDSLVYEDFVPAVYFIFPDTVNYPDSFIVVDTILTFHYFNYFSTVHVMTPGVNRIGGFPVSAGAFGIRWPGDTVIGAASALHLATAAGGLLATFGADGWLNAWRCGWSDRAAPWPMAGRTAEGSRYLPLEVLGQEVALSEFFPEKMFYNYPNPAGGSETRIRFYVNQPAEVTISVFDALGDRIWETREVVSDGNTNTEVPWNLAGVASGVYHCRIEANSLSGAESKVAFKTIAVVK